MKKRTVEDYEAVEKFLEEFIDALDLEKSSLKKDKIQLKQSPVDQMKTLGELSKSGSDGGSLLIQLNMLSGNNSSEKEIDSMLQTAKIARKSVEKLLMAYRDLRSRQELKDTFINNASGSSTSLG